MNTRVPFIVAFAKKTAVLSFLVSMLIFLPSEFSDSAYRQPKPPRSSTHLKKAVPSKVSWGGPPYAASILMRNVATGENIYEYESDRVLAPASLTKILSALVILDSGKLQDYVSITREMTRIPPSRIGIRRGDVFVLEDLLKAMLINSANDACLAAAIHVGGSEKDFVVLMNQYAQRLQLYRTHFTNPCGFDAPGHYSTAEDLADLTEIAMREPVFRGIVGTQRAVIRSVKRHRRYSLNNTNQLLDVFPGVEGVKTGYTSQAGRCVIARVNQDGKELLLVLMNAKRRWRTAANLIRYGLFLLDNSPSNNHNGRIFAQPRHDAPFYDPDIPGRRF